MTSFETAMLYHAHHALHPEDLPFWLDLAGYQAGPILELGCGTGRVLLPLLQAGHAAWGVDRDAGMLAVLNSHWRSDLSVAEDARPGPPVFQADFTRLHLALRFGLVILPCNTYTTLDAGARQALLACVAAHVDPQGQFALSLPNPQLLSSLPARGPAEIEEVFPHPLDGEPVQVSSSWRRSRRLFSLAWMYDHLQPDGGVQRTRVEIHHHLQAVEVYLDEMESAGFRPVAMYGDYDHTPFNPEAPYLILVLRQK